MYNTKYRNNNNGKQPGSFRKYKSVRANAYQSNSSNSNWAIKEHLNKYLINILNHKLYTSISKDNTFILQQYEPAAQGGRIICSIFGSWFTGVRTRRLKYASQLSSWAFCLALSYSSIFQPYLIVLCLLLLSPFS